MNKSEPRMLREKFEARLLHFLQKILNLASEGALAMPYSAPVWANFPNRANIWSAFAGISPIGG